MPDTLGSQLSTLMQQLANEIDRTKNAKRRRAIVRLQRKAAKQLQNLIDKTVPRTRQEYVEATEALANATEALKEARKDIEKVAKGIRLAGRAISSVAKLVAVL